MMDEYGGFCLLFPFEQPAFFPCYLCAILF